MLVTEYFVSFTLKISYNACILVDCMYAEFLIPTINIVCAFILSLMMYINAPMSKLCEF